MMSDSSGRLNLRTKGLPDCAPLFFDTKCLSRLKSHVDYFMAKRGDIIAASRLVKELVSSDVAMNVKAAFSGSIFLPVCSDEGNGCSNAIPLALAAHHSVISGGRVGLGVVQKNRARHTGARTMERLLYRAEFDGLIKPGERYVLVDDVSNSGGTLADLADFIQSGGGEVVGSLLLANCSRHGIVNGQDKKTHKIIGERYGSEITNLFGIEPSALTRDEARYLIGFRSADELRNRADAARTERSERLAAKDRLSRDDGGVGSAPVFC